MDDASFPSLVNQISCLLLHYLHTSANTLLLFVLLLIWFAAWCAWVMDSLEIAKTGKMGDMGFSDKHTVFFSVTHSKGHQSELIQNAWGEFRYLFSEINEFSGSCERCTVRWKVDASSWMIEIGFLVIFWVQETFEMILFFQLST